MIRYRIGYESKTLLGDWKPGSTVRRTSADALVAVRHIQNNPHLLRLSGIELTEEVTLEELETMAKVKEDYG